MTAWHGEASVRASHVSPHSRRTLVPVLQVRLGQRRRARREGHAAQRYVGTWRPDDDENSTRLVYERHRIAAETRLKHSATAAKEAELRCTSERKTER